MSVTGGSSPLTRGKPRASLVSRAGLGLIPAHAGKTSIPFITRIGSGAHPRSRGENRAGGRNPVSETGSSPLTRGKREMQMTDLEGTGLIPAHAGKT